MSINDLIELLEDIKRKHGNLEVQDSYGDELSPEVVEYVLVMADRA